MEGPDGGGKSTLIKQIFTQFPTIKRAARASEGVSGPVDDLYDWAVHDMAGWWNQPMAIYDRHPLVSEYIYGPICRGTMDPRFHDTGLRRRMARTALVIVCLPPLKVVRSSVSDERDMPGVATHIDAIWHCYASLKSCWAGQSGLLYYDYTKSSDRDLSQVFAYVNHHRDTWSYRVD